MADLLVPDWPAPASVCALQTLRGGGHSAAPWASFNLGDHVGDELMHVAANRADLRRHLPAEPLWLTQVHGIAAVDAAKTSNSTVADAAYTHQPGYVCAVMTADCLPVLLCDRAGTAVAAIHAGWRGLVAGVIEATVEKMRIPGEQLMAWLGPAIGPQHFEVGDEVRAAFVAVDAKAANAFVARGGGKWLADLYSLARQRLQAIGCVSIFGGNLCTYGDAERFYSYRRDKVTGRMASLIWLAGESGV